MTISAQALITGASAGAVLQLLRNHGPHTRAELSGRTGLARSTVSNRIDQLESAGLLAAVGESASTGGRPPIQFTLNPLARLVIAVDLGASHVTVAGTDLRGRVLAQRTEQLDVALGPEPVLNRVIVLIGQVQSQVGTGAGVLGGIGIGLPGPVEHETGRPARPPIMPGWDAFDVPALIRRSFDVPVLVDNDVNLMAIGEHTNNWPDVSHLLFIKVATGIGAGIISDGRINRGAQGAAGDLGHVQVPGGPRRRCRCGNTGCLEAIAAGPALALMLREKGFPVTGPPDVVDLVRTGDGNAIGVLREAGRHIGAVLASCVSLLNPSVVVIGGQMAAVGEYLLGGIREVVYGRALPLAAHRLQILTSKAGDRAGVLGGAAMVIDSLLSTESIDRELTGAG